MDICCFLYDKKNIVSRKRMPLVKRHDYMIHEDEAYGLGMSVAHLENDQRDNFNDAPFREFDFYLLSHIFAGEGKLFLQDTKTVYRLPKSSVVIIAPHTPHILGSVSDDYREDFIFFAGQEADNLANQGLLKTRVVTLDVRKRLLSGIREVQQTISPEYHFRAQHMLISLLLDIHDKQSCRPKDLSLIKLIDRITAEPQKTWSVKEMANFCGYSSAQLRRNFLQYTGSLPKNYVDEIKFQKAAELLLARVSINEICRILGFTDRFHFTRRFKEIFQISPRSFREKYSTVTNDAAAEDDE